MIEAVFQDHLTFLAFAITATLVAGIVAYLMAARRIDRAHAGFYGLWASSTIGPIALTTWGGSGILSFRCTINPSVTEVFTTTQGQLNILLFVPFGLFAVLATRRPLFGIAVGVLFTSTVEAAQATLPFVTRLCDTGDLVTNTVGIFLGASTGVIICHKFRYGTPLTPVMVRRTAIVGIATSLLIASTWITVIDPERAVVPAETPTASAHQVQELNLALSGAFGATYEVEEANFHNNIDGPSTLNAPLPGGFVELTWPDKEKLTVHFTPTSQGEGTYAYWIPGVSRPVRTADDAEQVATLFAKRQTPWGLRDSKVKVWPIDEKQDLGWVVEYRRWRGKLLMPMRLDILIEPSGRMTDLIARRVDDPKSLPQIKIGEEAAWKRFDAKHNLKPSDATRERPVYLVERHGDEWRIHWRLAARVGGISLSGTVDATTGEVRNAVQTPVGDQTPVVEEIPG
ncbi:VanZ family protein [Streptomyces sp. QHH-9511]|uniref:VanZ family protein n=1 Tax=Streptomyces sp. QHH-9511 TaxID=2684468 RepID=UPI0013196016|nr:VanZ family protein [Streptomyces sp. QHH-9511]QGZ52572.1 VanZ family protein [Streptomyces sp. QHH-9511]